MESDWLAALPRLRERVGERNFSTWIEPMRCASAREELCLEVESRFFQEWVTRHFLEVIQHVIGEMRGDVPAVRIVVGSSGSTSCPRSEPPRAKRAMPVARVPKVGRLVDEYTFANFVTGPANQIACQAARDITEQPGRRFNPFFVWGGVGLGKTHLVNALAHEMLRARSRRRVAVLPSETFMNSLIAALKEDQMGAFRERFRELDVLVLDDVQFLAGKVRTQEEFYHTFNALHEAGRQVVLTSDKPPHEIAALEQRLRSRFEGGLIVEIQPPTADMRLAIVLSKARRQGVELSPAVAELIAARSGPTVRELEGALTRVVASATLRGLPVDCQTAAEILAPTLPHLVAPSIEAVLQAVGRHFDLDVGDLTSHQRVKAYAFPRQVAMYLSRVVSQASFPSIGERFGGRDHSSVMYAVRTVEDKSAQDPTTARLLQNLERVLRGGTHA